MNRSFFILVLPIIFFNTTTQSMFTLGKTLVPRPLGLEDRMQVYTEMISCAAQNGKLDWLQELASIKVDGKSVITWCGWRPNRDGASPLFLASEKGHAEIVRFLLQKLSTQGSMCVFVSLKNGDKIPLTCLHIAAARGHHKVIQEILNLRELVSIQEAPKKRTPLHYAVAHGHVEAVRTLLKDWGIRKQAITPDEDGCTPLKLAVMHPNKEILDLFKPRCSLVEATQANNVALVQDLIELKFDLEEKDETFKATSLIWAANNGHEKILGLLLDAGADILAENKDGLNALDCAKKRGMNGSVAMYEMALQKKPERSDKGKAEANTHPGTN